MPTEEASPLSCANIMDIIKPWPYQTAPEFDPLRPRLADTTLSAEEKAKLMQEMCLSVVLVPLVSMGAPAERDAKQVASHMGECCKNGLGGSPESGEILPDILKTAAMEVTAATEGILALLDPLSSDAVTLLDEISNSRSGPLFVLKQALYQSDHYRKLEASLRECAVAHSSLGPGLATLTEKFRKKEANVDDVIRELPTLKSSLRVGATLQLEQALLEHMQTEFGTAKTLSSAAKVQALEQFLSAAAKVAPVLERSLSTTLRQLHVEGADLLSSARTDNLRATVVTYLHGFMDADGSLKQPVLNAATLKEAVSAWPSGVPRELAQDVTVSPLLQSFVRLLLHSLPTIIEDDADAARQGAEVCSCIATLMSGLEGTPVVDTAQFIGTAGAWVALTDTFARKAAVQTAGSLEQFFEDKNALLNVSQLLGSYRHSRRLLEDGTQTFVEPDQLKAVLATVDPLITSMAKHYAGVLTKNIKSETESAVAVTVPWKSGLAEIAAWGLVVEKANTTLLSKGKGPELLAAWRGFSKAEIELASS